MKERYRRIPIELIISPQYEGLKADAKLCYLTLALSPRQTPPGVYEGGMISLRYETSLSNKRLKEALKELVDAGLIEQITGGGWWVVDTFRDQCCNKDYAEAAKRHLSEKWPEYLPKFEKKHEFILGKHRKNKHGSTPPREDAPPSNPPQSPTGSEAVTGTETGSETDSGAGAAHKPAPATGSGSDSGGRGAGGGGGADTRDAPSGGAPASAPPQEAGNGIDKGEEGCRIPSGFEEYIKGLSLMKRDVLLTFGFPNRGNKEDALKYLRAAGFRDPELSRAMEFIAVKATNDRHEKIKKSGG